MSRDTIASNKNVTFEDWFNLPEINYEIGAESDSLILHCESRTDSVQYSNFLAGSVNAMVRKSGTFDLVYSSIYFNEMYVMLIFGSRLWF